MYKEILLLLFILLFASCMKQNQGGKIRIETDATRLDIDTCDVTKILLSERSDDGLYMNDLVDSVQYIPLETTRESLIGSISQLAFFNETFFVLDADNAQALFAFDSTGKYLWKIARIGNGPGEYSSLSNLSIDYSKKQIHLLSLNPVMKVMTFDLEGKFLSEIKIPFSTRSFTFLPNNAFVFYNGYCSNKSKLEKEYNLIQTDEKMNIQQAYDPYISDKCASFTLPISCFYTYNNSYNYFEDLRGYIYSIDKNGSLKRRFHIDFGEYTMDFDKRSLNTEDFNRYCRESDIYHLTNVSETDQFLFFKVHSKKKVFFAFYYKETGELRVGSQVESGFNEVLSADVKATTSDQFISVLDPLVIFQFKEAWATLSSQERALQKMNKGWQRVLDDFEEENNPTLVLFSIKKSNE